jgi:hypothetical protein
MKGRIYRGLEPVRRRQQAQLVARAGVLGLLASSVVGIGLGAWKWGMGVPLAPAWAWSVLAAGPVLGALVGLIRSWSWQQAARAVDDHYRLKDRAITALDFLGKAQTTPLHTLQVAEAQTHLTNVSAREVVPLRVPRAWPLAVAALAVAALLWAWPLASKKVVATPLGPNPVLVEEAEWLDQNLQQLDALAQKEKDKDLEGLVKELREKVAELKQPGVDQREALAKLSEMQAAIQAQQAQYNIGLMDAQLSALGEAMTAAESLEATGKALMETKFDRAAEQLEKMEEPPDLDRKEAKAVEEKVKQVAQAMGAVGLGQVGGAATEMAEGLKEGHHGKFRKGTKELAHSVRNHSSKRKLKQILDAEFEELEESKGRCKDCDKTYRVRRPEKSTNPSQDWGAGISGNVFGNKTNMKSNRAIKEVTGTPGDGPSEMETTHSPEGRQTAARSYREHYQKYRKTAEAVLETEPIPLGHRQTIRKYFELIRPQNLEPDKAEVVKDTQE